MYFCLHSHSAKHTHVHPTASPRIYIIGKITFTWTYFVHAPRHTHMSPILWIADTYTMHAHSPQCDSSTPIFHLHFVYTSGTHTHTCTAHSVSSHTHIAYKNSREYPVMCACTTDHQTQHSGTCPGPGTASRTLCVVPHPLPPHTYKALRYTLGYPGYGDPNASVKR